MNHPPETPSLAHVIATLLELMRKAGTVTTREAFEFLVVNETRRLVVYSHAALWSATEEGGRVVATSGHPRPDPDSPYIQWLSTLLRQAMSQDDHEGHLVLAKNNVSAPIGADWPDHLPPHGLLLPLNRRHDAGEGGLFLAREHRFERDEIVYLEDLAMVYGLAWHRITNRPSWSHRGWLSLLPRKRTLALLLLVSPLPFLPIRQSVLAPAEVVADQPIIIRSPMKGIVDRFLIRPNQEVATGDPLLVLDDKELKNRLEIALREQEIAVSELRTAEQQAVHGAETSSMATLLRLKVKQRSADVTYLEEKLKGVVIAAPRDGIAIFANPEDWIGRPIDQGERLFMLADPSRVALSIRLAVTDAIQLEPGDPITLFLHGRPADPIAATLTHVHYMADLAPDGTLAYRLDGTFDRPTPLARIGFRGSARIYHGRVTLGGHLVRKPWILIRQWLGI
ncbi:MAG: HlyD family efflux transporter periplasmic adaptor subunit [Magnetococcales bacterium]|nr:HlyD family efflux transporter periplasmic adaptor subunit [Magnetococcales bacterium]